MGSIALPDDLRIPRSGEHDVAQREQVLSMVVSGGLLDLVRVLLIVARLGTRVSEIRANLSSDPQQRSTARLTCIVGTDQTLRLLEQRLRRVVTVLSVRRDSAAPASVPS
jgi:acetolactate synthase regulatory subunit